MNYTITNLTDSSRNNSPNHGDLLRYVYDNGTTLEKKHHDPTPTTEEIEREAKEWRNSELQNTDFIVPLSDYPNRDAWLTYRQELRDWTATDDFPDTKPTKP
jgi:hypothetical protein